MENYIRHSDFEMIYDDWMVTSGERIKPDFSAKELVTYIEKKYLSKADSEIDDTYDHLYDKALAMQQKLAMMQYAIYNYSLVKADFESTQNMTIPALYGMGKTKILFYVESAIVFARNALDVSASIYSRIILDSREDSFNTLCKKIDKQENYLFDDFKASKASWQEDASSVFNLLCGTTRGRAIRDIIIHQANVKIDYYEYKENSEREKLFIELHDFGLIDLDIFMDDLSDGLCNIFNVCNKLCQKIINNK